MCVLSADLYAAIRSSLKGRPRKDAKMLNLGERQDRFTKAEIALVVRNTYLPWQLGINFGVNVFK
jgi:hypothetical protein